MSICETVKTWKWYYVLSTRSADFPIERRLCRERQRAEREREAMSIYKTVKTWKWHNVHVYARSAYFPD